MYTQLYTAHNGGHSSSASGGLKNGCLSPSSCLRCSWCAVLSKCVRVCVCVNVLLSLRDKSIPGFEPKPALGLDPVKVEVGVRVSQSWGS